MGLIYSPLCRCGAEQQTSAHVLCECEALATLRLSYLGSLCSDPEDIRSLILGENLELSYFQFQFIYIPFDNNVCRLHPFLTLGFSNSI